MFIVWVGPILLGNLVVMQIDLQHCKAYDLLQFIEERLDILNAGLGFSDEFEMEVCNYSDKASSKLKQQYREWLFTMRKDTSAFFKNVKSRVSTIFEIQ